jgi:hypothetical protein
VPLALPRGRVQHPIGDRVDRGDYSHSIVAGGLEEMS